MPNQPISRELRDPWSEKAVRRFWAAIEKRAPDECWEWKRAKNPRGYGLSGNGGVTLLTHRIAWALVNGAIPIGKFVCHACDNPPCCNPAHLWIGSPSDNARDMAQKGRAARNAGEKCGRRKLALRDVQEIRALLATGEKARLIAPRYGVNVSLIHQINRGDIWAQSA